VKSILCILIIRLMDTRGSTAPDLRERDVTRMAAGGAAVSGSVGPRRRDSGKPDVGAE
jgi:hypothetical protein